MLDKEWVKLQRADPAYERGAWNFVRTVAAQYGDNVMIICPCIDCRNVDRHLDTVIVDQLVTRGMEEGYKMHPDWFHHEEVNSGAECVSNSKQWNDEIFGLYQAAEFLDEELERNCDMAEGEDKLEDEFLAKLADAKTLLYPSCFSHRKLSAIVSLFRLKTQNGWSEKSFNDLLETLPEMLPEDNILHTSLYEVKKFLKTFDMGYEKIHACINDCCLFRKKYKKNDNFNMKNTRYSCWTVLLVNYNMPPYICMNKENIMLTLLIPGPHQLGNNIDVHLEPLIEDLNHLWSDGELTYDAFSKSTFTLKAMLLWTISDFPAYGNLTGCKVKGKMGCHVCGKHTDSLWLRNSRKHVYMCQLSFLTDPYILTSQAKQIFYSREDDSSNWYVAMRGPSRRYSEEDAEHYNLDVGPVTSTINMDHEDLHDDAQNARTDCEGFYV